MASFAALGLDEWVCRQCAAMQLTQPTEVQTACIPPTLQGTKHVVGGAATGSGKTAAFALPILQHLCAEMYGVFALVLTPSRELAYQIIDQFVAFGAPVGLRTAIIIGGAPHGAQIDMLKKRPHVVVATPGRLQQLFETYTEVLQAFRHVRYLVLDEADRLTEGDIKASALEVVRLLGPPRPQRRTLLYSATINSALTDVSEGLLPLLGVTSQDSLAVCATSTQILEAERSVRTVAPNLTQQYLFVPTHVKLHYLVALLRTRDKSQSAIIFTNSCLRTEVVRLTLQLLGFPVASLNSLLTQQQRLNNLAMFKAGLAKFLVATDIASRGLDIPAVDLVVHYDFPKLSAAYVHRVGRTARAGREGTSIAITTDSDVYLVHKTERRTKSKMAKLKHPDVNETAVMKILDHVSNAKVEARLAAKKQYGDRAAVLKEIGAERRSEVNRAIRNDRIGTGRRPRSADAAVQPQPDAAVAAPAAAEAPAQRAKRHRDEGTAPRSGNPKAASKPEQRKERKSAEVRAARPKQSSSVPRRRKSSE